MKRRRIANGTKVIIKENVDSWAAGECGIIKHFDGEYYHVAVTGDDKMQLIFLRSELKIAK